MLSYLLQPLSKNRIRCMSVLWRNVLNEPSLHIKHRVDAGVVAQDHVRKCTGVESSDMNCRGLDLVSDSIKPPDVVVSGTWRFTLLDVASERARPTDYWVLVDTEFVAFLDGR